MHKLLFSCFIITILFFVIYGQNDSNITLVRTTTENNTTIAISLNSVKIVVKCRDTNSLLTNINLDNSGSLTMNNNEIDENTVDQPILIMFDTCQPRTSGLLSLFKSFSSNTASNDSLFNFSSMSFFKKINFDNQTQNEPLSGNETTTMD